MLQQNLHSVRFRSWFKLLPVLLLSLLLLSRCVLTVTVANPKHTKTFLQDAQRTHAMEHYLNMLIASPDTIPSPPDSTEDMTMFQSSVSQQLPIQTDDIPKWDAVDEDQESFRQHQTSIESWSSKATTVSLNQQRPMNVNRHGGRKRKHKSIPSAMSEAITQGIQMAIEECKHQFQNDHWNCPTLEGKKGKAMFGQLLNKEYRETAFVYAIRSAGIAYSVTKACSDGLIRNCRCQHQLPVIENETALSTPISSTQKDNWSWSGCSDDVEFGIQKAKQLLDVRLRARPADLHTLFMSHNYDAGRLAIKENVRLTCKCHGVSGSCTLRTCWQRLSSFRQIGDWLKTRFENATKVMTANDGISFVSEKSSNLSPTSTDLIYTEQSPSFCTPSQILGIEGTRGRHCEPLSTERYGCDQLCCGRGYATVRRKIHFNCRCTFLWCCDVQCQHCEKEIDIHICR